MLSKTLKWFDSTTLEAISKNGFWFNPPEADKYQGGREV